MNTVLSLKDVCKSYGNFQLDNVSFELKRGFVMGLIGPNGAGKSTTIKLIMNLIKRDKGTIELFGLDNIRYEREVKNKIGLVYDVIPFYGMLTINEMKSLIAPFYSQWNEAQFKQYLRDFQLDPGKKIDNLSKGMKTKLSLAIALSHNAELIIMDEPTSGLDPVFRSELLDILYNIIQDENKAILFSTHITTDLERIADYITFLNNGKVVFSKPKDEIMEEYSIVKGGTELLTKELRDHFIGIRETSTGFSALTSNADALRKQCGDKIKLEKASLEDIMVYMIRGERHA
jgi:ABC-2 type transport system ATP-binding protein